MITIDRSIQNETSQLFNHIQYIISIIIITLLMPKLIIPKRTDKNLSVDDYWRIRNQFAKPQFEHTPVYRQEEVNNRYKFARVSEQVYYFNPLLYFLTKKTQADPDKTYTQIYMQQIRYRLPEQIMRIKQMMFGLAAILQNLHRILNVLWDHLENEDSWILMQTLIKDTKTESYDIWIEEGLEKITKNIDTSFSMTKFRHVFDILCVFMENCYPKIVQSQANTLKFFNEFANIYFIHPNKYLRQFSVKASSYIFSNMEEEYFRTFIKEILNSENAELCHYLSDFLAARLKYSAGCMTPHSLEQLINMIKWLKQSFDDQQFKIGYTELITIFIKKVIINMKDLTESKTNEQSMNLFDLHYVLKGLIELCQGRYLSPMSIIMPIDFYMHEHEEVTSKNKRHMKKFKKTLSKRVKTMVFEYLWEYLGQLERNESTYRMLGASFCEQLSFLDSFKAFIAGEIDHEKILYFLESLPEEESISKGNVQILVYSLCGIIKEYLSRDCEEVTKQLLQIVYKIILLSKNQGFSLKAEAISANIGSSVATKSAKLLKKSSQGRYFHSIVLLRLLSILQVSKQSKPQIEKSILQLYTSIIKPYQQMIQSELSQQQRQSSSLYDIYRYRQQILIHNNTSVPSMLKCLTIIESVLQLQNTKSMNIIQSVPQIFEKVFINRLSFLAVHKKQSTYKNKQENLYNMVQAKQRQVREFAIKSLLEQNDTFRNCGQSSTVLKIILEIDSDRVDLETQRQVKRLFLELSRQISKLPKQKTAIKQILFFWGLGFAYTGFSLIQNSFIDFMKELLESSLESDLIKDALIKYLELETFKNSRIYPFEIKKIFPDDVQTEATVIDGTPILQMIKIDIGIAQDETVDSIGANRIAKAVGLSQKTKKSLGNALTNLLDQYFGEQFMREKTIIRELAEQKVSYQEEVHGALLMPPKIAFLEFFILKLPSSEYQPPLQCLQLTKTPYLALSSIHKIKRQSWQLNWTKAANNKTKKNNQKQILGVTIDFERMSMEEKQIYVHFLFGELLKGNEAKLRKIIQYIRDYIPETIPYFLELLVNKSLLSNVIQFYNPKNLNFSKGNDRLIRNIFRFMNSRKLLTYLYIMKASIKCLTFFLREGACDHLLYLLIQLLDVIKSKKPEELEVEQQMFEQEGDDYGNDNEKEQNEEAMTAEKSKDNQYKNHRKEAYKILTLIFHELSGHVNTDQLDKILIMFHQQNKICNLPSAAANSVPGLMLLLKQVSSNCLYSPMLFRYGIIESLSSIFLSCQSKGYLHNPGRTSVMICLDTLSNILGIHDESYIADQSQLAVMEDNKSKMKALHKDLLTNMFTYLKSISQITNTIKKNSSDSKTISFMIFRILKICEVLTQINSKVAIEMQPEWQSYLLKELQKLISRNMSLSQRNKQKLECILKIIMNYVYYQQGSAYDQMIDENQQKMREQPLLVKLIYLLPHITDITHRQIIIDSVKEYTEMGCNNISIDKSVAHIASCLTTTIPNSLEHELDFVKFFNGINDYKKCAPQISIKQHQYILYCLLAYLNHQQFSIRKAINNALLQFLNICSIENKKVVAKLFRNVTEYLKKPSYSQQQLFWSIVSIVGNFIRWICRLDDSAFKQGYSIFEAYLSFDENNQNDIIEQLCSLSQNKKMEALKRLKILLFNCPQKLENKLGSSYPNLISCIILPILQHLIFPPPPSPHENKPISNLSATLSHMSLQAYEISMTKASQSLQKKQLKRLVTKLKLETNAMGVNTSMVIKKNILVIKIISKIIQAINLPDSTKAVKDIIKESGFDQLHRKIVEKQSKFTNVRQQMQQMDNDEQEDIKKKAFNGINNQIDDEELINMNYLAFDKKLMKMQEEEENNQENSDEQKDDINKKTIRFLKFNVLSPLKTLLMYENKSEKNNVEENDKSRMYLSIAVTKIIMKFPLDTFLIELQKVLSKLGRLLKKKKYEIRENARKCLAQIAKLVGPQMLYMIIRQLKFHLRDNFQNHVLNYTIYYILEKLSSSPKSSGAETVNLSHISIGSLDHILPLLLPPVIDEIFGFQSQQKQQVDENLIPTLNIESKKRKGYELLSILCKYISIDKIQYLIKYFQKFLKDYMNTEANLMKYEEMLNAVIFSGLSKNQSVINPTSSIIHVFIEMLHNSIEGLKSEIKIYKFETNLQASHQSTVKQSKGKAKKKGLKQTYELQQEAGRNGSIFKKQQKTLKQHRNREILINALLQFYLALMTMLVKRKIINKQNFQHFKIEDKENFNTIISFIVECLDHRDNRILNKCLKIIHYVINWNNIGEQVVDVTDNSKSTGNKKLLKKVCRKIFTLIEKLTSSDQQLLRQCFTLLNDVLAQVSITLDLLPTIMTIVKLHIQTNQQSIIEQPYKLFKTVLYKISNTPMMFEESVKEMYQFIRMTLINTSMDKIRGICRLICLIYIRQIDIEQTIQFQKIKKSNFSIGFKDEVSFYLNNLDCKYTENQLCIIDILEEAIKTRNKKDLEETGEIIIMALGTAYANNKQNGLKMKALIHLIISKIDRSKSIKLMDKAILWCNNTSNKLIPICGYFLLNSMLSFSEFSSQQLSTEQLCKILQNVSKILEEQKEKVAIFYDKMKSEKQKREAIKNNPSWAEIIKQGEYFDNFIEIDSRIQGCFNTIDWLVDQHVLKPNKKNQQREKSIRSIVELLWELVSVPSSTIYLRVASIVLKLQSLSYYLGNGLLSSNRQSTQSLRTKLVEFCKNTEQQHIGIVSQICKKILLELVINEQTQQYLQGVISLLMNKINKSVLSIKRNQSVMKISITLANIIFHTSQQVRKQLVKDQSTRGDILRTIAKITRNELIPSTVKECAEQLSQTLKKEMGQSEFYRKIAQIEAQRKQKRGEQKIKLSKLAITDQEQYYEHIKGKKKHKKN